MQCCTSLIDTTAWLTQHCIGYLAKKSFLSTMGQYYRGNSYVQCWPTKIRVTLQIIFLCKVVHGLWINIAQATFLCNVSTNRLRQHCIGYFPAKTCLCNLGQHCTINLQMQCCLRRIWATLTRQYSNAMFAPAWSTQHCIDYFSHKSCLFAMGQHYKDDFLVHCWRRKIRTPL